MTTHSPGAAPCWGKRDDTAYHPLSHHCADVAATLEALFELPVIRRRLAVAAAVPHWHPGQLQRLCALAFLHDAGKVLHGFQGQLDSPPRAPRRGHVQPLVDLLYHDGPLTDWVHRALSTETLLRWDDAGGEASSALLIAVMAHHGEPLAARHHPDDFSEQWRASDHGDPVVQMQHLGALARRWFPSAYAEAPPLPSSPEFQHLFAGYVALADWIGSDTAHFPYTAPHSDDYIGLARERARQALRRIGLDTRAQRAAARPPAEHAALFGHPRLRALQRAVHEAPLSARALVLEAETGAGKTEAALLRFASLYFAGEVDSLYFSVPTRAAAAQLHRRVAAFCARLLPLDTHLQTILAVPGYLRAGAAQGARLPGFVVQWDDAPDAQTEARRWAAGHGKRFLAAQFAVGTIDQAMLGVLQRKHAHLRSSCLGRSLLVIDELHSSDHYMRPIVAEVVRTQLAQGGHVLMMSATLGAQERHRWLSSGAAAGRRTRSSPDLRSAIDAPYPALSWGEAGALVQRPIARSRSAAGKTVQMQVVADSAEGDALLATVWRATAAGAKVLVICNTVSGAIARWRALAAHPAAEPALLFGLNGIPTLHHSRFAAEDRRRLDAAVEQHFGGARTPGGRLLVGTQTLEQSLDIDADLLVSELCPVDVLLQRVGRLHRHRRGDRPAATEQPTALVISPHARALDRLLDHPALGLGDPERSVYPDLLGLQATLDQLNERPVWDIPSMNRALVEAGYHHESRAQLLAGRGARWQSHEQRLSGGQIADGLSARAALIDRSVGFGEREVLFRPGGTGAAVATRLGADQLRVALPAALNGPFEEPVQHFAIPAWLLPSADREAPPALTSACRVDDHIRLVFGEHTLRYDRTGLTGAGN